MRKNAKDSNYKKEEIKNRMPKVTKIGMIKEKKKIKKKENRANQTISLMPQKQ